jgi:release factor glutamine methyltransferase
MLIAAADRTRLVATLRAAGCVYAEDEARLLAGAATSAEDLDRMVHLRSTGQPLEHVVGYADFAGVRVLLDAGVFVPRRRTEYLVDLAARRLTSGSTLVDLCCGSGALGVALGHRVPGITVYAADVDPAAVRCARRNMLPTGGHVYEGDLFAPLPARLLRQVDVIVANVPYVPTAEIALLPAEAREHEPVVALDGGADGLAVLRQVAAGAPDWLRPGGHLLVETSAAQAADARSAFAANGFRARVATARRPWGLRATVVVGALA